MNFLVSPEVLHSTITQTRFRELAWNDTSDWSLNWFQERVRAQQNGSPAPGALGLQLLFGAEFSTITRNLILNLQEGRIRVVEGIFEGL